ncbi:hypothetical protein J2X65_001682 [Ancylobacter sp. 3268]|uniref:hypothetical protein n=1 Tax=Ancylobacter sp. 3268 TaxID=2817752 RepID=UPI00285E6C41|nr:hypothetical protein [Ancylobacter sp. 3268]MDR6952327.1 hypothetical protein [Ancylobacter sp. 3268]
MNAPLVWLQSLNGRAIDMVEPRADQVDFAEIADTLSTLNRYSGAAEKPVSVALHTLVALDCAIAFGANPRWRALVLLHDLHEQRLGDETTPCFQAMLAIALQVFGLKAEDHVRQVRAELRHRHDIAIHVAAGIAMPTAEERLFIRFCDIAALKTERRDFLATPPMPWGEEIEHAPALPRPIRWRKPPDAAADLKQAFIDYLPGARAQSDRAPANTARVPA